MKIAGVILILTGCVGLGFWFSLRYTKRLKNLWEIKKAMQILKGEISFGRTPLPHALEQAGKRTQGKIGDFFTYIAEELYQGGRSIQEVWKNAAETILNENELRKDDRKQLEEMGEMLGYLDVEMQLQTLGLLEHRLQESIREFTEEKRNRTRLYPVLGFMCGALVCLVIL